jgi:hypothetical protein
MFRKSGYFLTISANINFSKVTFAPRRKLPVLISQPAVTDVNETVTYGNYYNSFCYGNTLNLLEHIHFAFGEVGGTG